MEINISNRSFGLCTRQLPLVEKYSTALNSYLTRWRDRTATILQSNNCSVGADVSGGLDTRTVVGFLKVAGEDSLRGQSPKVDYKTTSGLNFEKDEEISQIVADSLGLKLNRLKRSAGRFSNAAEQVFNTWRDRNLGQYATMRFADGILDPQKLCFGVKRVKSCVESISNLPSKNTLNTRKSDTEHICMAIGTAGLKPFKLRWKH